MARPALRGARARRGTSPAVRRLQGSTAGAPGESRRGIPALPSLHTRTPPNSGSCISTRADDTKVHHGSVPCRRLRERVVLWPGVARPPSPDPSSRSIPTCLDRLPRVPGGGAGMCARALASSSEWNFGVHFSNLAPTGRAKAKNLLGPGRPGLLCRTRMRLSYLRQVTVSRASQTQAAESRANTPPVEKNSGPRPPSAARARKPVVASGSRSLRSRRGGSALRGTLVCEGVTPRLRCGADARSEPFSGRDPPNPTSVRELSAGDPMGPGRGFWSGLAAECPRLAGQAFAKGWPRVCGAEARRDSVRFSRF